DGLDARAVAQVQERGLHETVKLSTPQKYLIDLLRREARPDPARDSTGDRRRRRLRRARGGGAQSDREDPGPVRLRRPQNRKTASATEVLSALLVERGVDRSVP